MNLSNLLFILKVSVVNGEYVTGDLTNCGILPISNSYTKSLKNKRNIREYTNVTIHHEYPCRIGKNRTFIQERDLPTPWLKFLSEFENYLSSMDLKTPKVRMYKIYIYKR